MSRKNVCIPEPSVQLAWFLGVLAGDGYVSSNPKFHNMVLLRATSLPFVQKFMCIGAELFGITGSTTTEKLSQKNNAWNDAYLGIFYSANLVEFFGDFRAEQWPKTLQEKHTWVIQSEESLWAFLTGYFDSEGSVSDPTTTRRHRIRYAIAYRVVATFLAELLAQVNITSSLEHSVSKREGISAIGIYGRSQIQRFAQHVISSVSEKESRLALYRHARIIEGPSEQVLRSYREVKRLREETGLGAKMLARHPELAEFCLKPSTIRNWIHAGNNPERDGGFYSSISFVSFSETRHAN